MISVHMFPVNAHVIASLGNHLWQSTLFVGIAGLMTLVFRSNRSSLRYVVWTAASIKFLLPFSLLVGLGAILPKALPASTESQSLAYLALQATSEPFNGTHPIIAPIDRANSTILASVWIPELLLAVWLCGTLVVLLVWCIRWRQVSIAVRTGEVAPRGREARILQRLQGEMKLRGRIQIVHTQQMTEPGIFGIFRPVLLWPTELTAHLDDAHVRAILAHELLHVRRKDNLMAAMHMLVEALFWFHPMVWWLESRIVQERERACDEAVLELIDEPELYAEGLLKACRFCLESPLICVSGIAGSNLRDRILRITSRQSGLQLSLARKIVLGAVAFAIVAVPMAFGTLGAMPSQGSLLHPTVSPLPAFEVATIKPNKDAQGGLRIDLSPSDFNARGGSVQELIEFAFNVNSHDQLQGQPGWTSSQRFDIHAKASDDEIARIHNLPAMQQVTQLRLMLQSLLADRFQLKVSCRKPELPVYALVVARGGPKLREVEVDPLPSPGMQPRPGAHLPRLGKTGANQYTATAWDMGSTADFLSRFDEVGHRMVVDETGLKGHYDFVLNGISVGPSADGTATSIFTALKEQLGLELVPRKAPVEVLVIDHVEPPSGN